MVLNMFTLTNKERLEISNTLAAWSHQAQHYFCIQLDIDYLVSEKQHNFMH